MKIKQILLCLTLIVILSGCKPPEISELDYFYFDTSINIKIYDKVDEATLEQIDTQTNELLTRLENTYSPSIEDSIVNQVNAHQITEVDDEFIEILNYSLEACNVSDGIYDPTSGSLIDLWSINNDNYLPRDSEVIDALANVGCENVTIDGNQITMPYGYALDFGSSVKGYAGDQIEQILKENGIENGLINLGGNIQAVGNKYGKPFTIALMTPEVDNQANENVATLQLEDSAMVTSGINQRFFISDGEVYHHIINANEGYPENNNLASVSIITDEGVRADILSTMVFLMGLEEGMEYVNSVDDVEAIFITRDKKIYQTQNFDLNILDESYQIVEI